MYLANIKTMTHTGATKKFKVIYKDLSSYQIIKAI